MTVDIGDNLPRGRVVSVPAGIIAMTRRVTASRFTSVGMRLHTTQRQATISTWARRPALRHNARDPRTGIAVVYFISDIATVDWTSMTPGSFIRTLKTKF